MTSIKVVPFNTGEVARVYKSLEEEAVYANLPPLTNVQAPVVIDLESNPRLAELVDGNNWHLYRINAGIITRDGQTVAVHPASEAEADRLALPNVFDRLRDYRQLDPLDAATTAAQVRARLIETQAALDDVIRALRYIVKNQLRIVP